MNYEEPIRPGIEVPSYRCLNPLCSAYVRERTYCPDCAKQHGVTGSRHTYYDQHLRDPEARAFYSSAAWSRARFLKLSSNPTCARCGKLADTVHHVIPVKTATQQERLDQSLLVSLCAGCHSALEREISSGRA